MGWLSDITDDFLGLDDSGGIGGTAKKVGDEIFGLDDTGGMGGPLTKLGANFEDALVDAGDSVTDALENKYIRAIVKTISKVSPDPFTRGIATFLDAYTTANDGDELSAGQWLSMVTSTVNMYQASATATVDAGATADDFDSMDSGTGLGNAAPNVFSTAAETLTNPIVTGTLSIGADVADGSEFNDALLNYIQKPLVEALTGKTIDALEFDVDKADVAALTNTVVDYAETGELSTAIANNLGDFTAKHVFNLNTGQLGPQSQETINKIAGVKAGLTGLESLDQGEELNNALLAAGTKYFTSKGEAPLGTLNVSDLISNGFSGFGINLKDMVSGLGVDFNLPDLPDFLDPNLEFPTVELAGKYLWDNGWGFDDITKLPGFEGIDLNVDLGVELGNLQFNPGDFDGDFGNFDIVLPDRIDMTLPDLSIGTEITLPDAPEITKIELPSFSIPEIPEIDLEIPEIDLEVPEIDLEVPEIDLEVPEVPEVPEVDIETPEVDIDLDLNLPSRQLARFAGLLKDDEEEEKRALQEYKFAQGLRDLGTIDIPT